MDRHGLLVALDLAFWFAVGVLAGDVLVAVAEGIT